jgi:hypothetical protein
MNSWFLLQSRYTSKYAEEKKTDTKLTSEGGESGAVGEMVGVLGHS